MFGFIAGLFTTFNVVDVVSDIGSRIYLETQLHTTKAFHILKKLFSCNRICDPNMTSFRDRLIAVFVSSFIICCCGCIGLTAVIFQSIYILLKNFWNSCCYLFGRITLGIIISLAFAFLVLFVSALGTAAVLIKLSNMNFITTNLDSWKAENFITFFGFLNQMANVATFSGIAFKFHFLSFRHKASEVERICLLELIKKKGALAAFFIFKFTGQEAWVSVLDDLKSAKKVTLLTTIEEIRKTYGENLEQPAYTPVSRTRAQLFEMTPSTPVNAPPEVLVVQQS